ncbi:MAG TPA: glutamate-cysteine ligase family protein [Candidatus Krumholzibacteria bacterium]|nr:glutamate-cysteine ligase family protein [Candidatus Krumholzibacteria bacterium]
MAQLHLFDAYGIELEYMVVDAAGLDVRPLADRVLVDADGAIDDEMDMGDLGWSNELVGHVVELKTNGPAPRLDGLAARFAAGVAEVERRLEPLGARLLGTAMHPWMDPHRETVLWPHGSSAIYESYNRIFDCRGHGWSNLQSTHINLPFAGDDEFGRLHAAIRLVLPLLPALAASSPVVEGRVTGLADNRLEFYRNNQRRVPQLTGRVVPEPMFTRADYEAGILEACYRAIAPHDPQELMRAEWLNSRGAIARFDRGAIEIRVLDIQECPLADIAVASLVVAVIRALCQERWASQAAQQAVPTDPLADLLLAGIRDADRATVDLADLRRCLGLPAGSSTAADAWRRLAAEVADAIPVECRPALAHILDRGPLARRILAGLPEAPDRAALRARYGELADCLRAGRLLGM